jgi:hypothetical protein
VTGTATIKNVAGASERFTCFDTQGLKVGLAATNNSGGSGVAGLTYAATGAQRIASTTVSGASAQPSITTRGLTTLTYAAKDMAGNQEATRSESVIVGLGYACAGPTPAPVKWPTHGTLLITGTPTVTSRSYPVNLTISF